MTEFDLTDLELDPTDVDEFFASLHMGTNRTPVLSISDLELRSPPVSPLLTPESTPRSSINLNPQLTEGERLAANAIGRTTARYGNQLLRQDPASFGGLNLADPDNFAQVLALHSTSQLTPPIATASLAPNLAPIFRPPSYAPRVNTTTTTVTTTATPSARGQRRNRNGQQINGRGQQVSNPHPILFLQDEVEPNRPHPNEQFRKRSWLIIQT
jgi:hypothetical protein